MTLIRNGICAVVTLTLLLAPGAAPSSPQDAAQNKATIGDGMSVGDMLKAWTAETGRKFIWREGTGVREKRVTVTGAVEHQPADADFMYESMLASTGLVLIPAGPPDSKLFAVDDIERPGAIKSRARFVTRDAFPTLVRFPAQVFTTVIPLKHVSAENVRNALSWILTNRNAEFAMDVQSANAVMIVGFGPTIAAMGELIAAVDIPGAPIPKPPEPEKK